MSNIEQRLNFISQRMQQIRNSGEIAAPNTWIQKFYVPKNGKRYEYYRLMKACSRKSKTGKIQGQIERYLGKLGSKLYKRFTAAIDRRNKLQKLENIYQKLLAILQSEAVSGGILTQRDNKDPPRKIPTLKKLLLKIDLMEKAIALLQKNQEELWNWVIVVVQKVGVAIAEHDRLSGGTLAEDL